MIRKIASRISFFLHLVLAVIFILIGMDLFVKVGLGPSAGEETSPYVNIFFYIVHFSILIVTLFGVYNLIQVIFQLVAKKSERKIHFKICLWLDILPTLIMIPLLLAYPSPTTAWFIPVFIAYCVSLLCNGFCIKHAFPF